MRQEWWKVHNQAEARNLQGKARVNRGCSVHVKVGQTCSTVQNNIERVVILHLKRVQGRQIYWSNL